MSQARVGHIAVRLPSGKVLIAGGWISASEATASAELYDPSLGTFTHVGNMSVPRARPAGVALANGDVLIAGGADREGASGALTAEVFHPASQTCERVGSMHVSRLAGSATVLKDGRVLFAGGGGDRVTASAEIYDPKTRRFQLTGNMVVSRYKHTAGLLPDGRVLIAGGSDDRDWNGTMRDAEIYDPSRGTFEATAPLAAARFKLPNEAVLLSSGKLLIAGGSSQVEIYDPAAKMFSSAAGQVDEPWHYMSATKLADGTVLLAGGYPNRIQATAQAWIVRP